LSQRRRGTGRRGAGRRWTAKFQELETEIHNDIRRRTASEERMFSKSFSFHFGIDCDVFYLEGEVGEGEAGLSSYYKLRVPELYVSVCETNNL